MVASLSALGMIPLSRESLQIVKIGWDSAVLQFFKIAGESPSGPGAESVESLFIAASMSSVEKVMSVKVGLSGSSLLKNSFGLYTVFSGSGLLNTDTYCSFSICASSSGAEVLSPFLSRKGPITDCFFENLQWKPIKTAFLSL